MTATFVHTITFNITILIISYFWLLSFYYFVAHLRVEHFVPVNWRWNEYAQKSFQYCLCIPHSNARGKLFKWFFFYYQISWRVFITWRWDYKKCSLFIFIFSDNLKRTPAVHNCGFVHLNIYRLIIKILLAAHESGDFQFWNLYFYFRDTKFKCSKHLPKNLLSTSICHSLHISFHFTPSFCSQSIELHQSPISVTTFHLSALPSLKPHKA